MLAALVVAALIVVAIILITHGNSPTVVHYRKVVGNDVSQAVDQMQQLIDKYTK
jgi:beta-lactam-binding protein with PASTA domain